MFILATLLQQATQQPVIVTSQIPNSTILTIISIIVALLVSSGAAAWWFRSGTDMKLAQRDSASALAKADTLAIQVTSLSSTSGQHEAIINEIRSRMCKLDKIDEMSTAVEYMKEATKRITDLMVPRPELERKFEADDKRFERIEIALDDRRVRVDDRHPL